MESGAGGKHDACYVPRVAHHNRDIRVHEVAWAGDELWVVNTRFSCLCTLDRRVSFVPRWKPTFVSALAPEDRCHLNGLCVVGDPPRPKYVTCLGATDTAGGWRVNKKNGGLLIDVETNDVLADGFPCRTRHGSHDGKLWVLESGYGGLGYLDAKTGKVVRVATLPGSRGGSISSARSPSSAVAGAGNGRVQWPADHRIGGAANCGVWVVDTRTGQVLGFLRFEAGVREIFAVHALVGTRYPTCSPPTTPAWPTTFVLPRRHLTAQKNPPSIFRRPRHNPAGGPCPRGRGCHV